MSTMTSSPASLALDAFLAPPTSSNKRVKRSTMDSPQASSFSFDMSELFAAASLSSSQDYSFPSIAWSFDDADDEEDAASVSSTCTTRTTLTTSVSESSLGKRSRSGLIRSKTSRTSLDLLG